MVRGQQTAGMSLEQKKPPRDPPETPKPTRRKLQPRRGFRP